MKKYVELTIVNVKMAIRCRGQECPRYKLICYLYGCRSGGTSTYAKLLQICRSGSPDPDKYQLLRRIIGAVPRITQSRKNKHLVVELFIYLCDMDFDIGMLLADDGQALRGADKVQ